MPGETTTTIQNARTGRRLADDPDLRRVLLARSLRAFGDGYVAILLPLHLIRLDFGPYAVGVITAATLLGSALLTLAFGRFGHGMPRRTALLAASFIMAATGLAFAGVREFWPLLLVAFVGTLNPSGGDVSVFLPIEHTIIAHVAGPLNVAHLAKGAPHS
jgi:MFS family permease